jgi:hypothetical protein
MRCSYQLASFLLACVGCGSVYPTGHLPDAPPAPDAGIDAVTRGTVRVTVLDPSGSGAPAVGANVVFLDPDGTLVKRVASDTAGKAEADVLPGASVTSIVFVNTQYRLLTVLGAKPGDDLVLGTRNGDGSTAGTFTVNYPALAGATSYGISSPCGATFFSAPAAGGPPAPAQLTLFNSCKLDTMEIVVVPQGANGPLTSIAKPGVAFLAGGTTTISGNYQGLRTLTASYTNINPIITGLNMSRGIPDGFGFVDTQSMTSPGATLALSSTGPQASTGQLLTVVGTATGSSQRVRQSISGTAATYGLDLGATLLPWIGSPTYDAASRKLVVPTDTTGTSAAKPDLFRIIASYARTDANNVTTSFNWTLFGPDATDIVLPVLPPELGNIAPTATDTVTVTSAQMFDADSVTSYDQIRNDVSNAFSLHTGSRPPATTVRFSAAPGKRAL